LSSSRYPIAYANVRVFSHATEDPDKVQTAVRNTLPEAVAKDLVFTKTSLIGHHGNPILVLEAEITDRLVLPLVLEKFGAMLNSLDKEQLNSEWAQHIEKKNLYLRFDKQAAFLGELRLGNIDPIHYKLHFKNRTTEEITEICRKAGLLQ
jgi:RNA binding exosome subunit